MDIKKIIKKEEFKQFVKIARNLGREIIDTFFSKIPYKENDKVEEIAFFGSSIDFLRKKWVIEILWELETHKGSNFNELKRKIKGISSKILSNRLKELQKSELILREIQKTRPPSVFYSLTDKGKGFVEIATLGILFLKSA